LETGGLRFEVLSIPLLGGVGVGSQPSIITSPLQGRMFVFAARAKANRVLWRMILKYQTHVSYQTGEKFREHMV
jgi:hypothetical protein